MIAFVGFSEGENELWRIASGEGVVFFNVNFLLARNESFRMSRVAFGHSQKERGVQMRVFRRKRKGPDAENLARERMQEGTAVPIMLLASSRTY